jgi:SAM-dependent methyltransferase
VFTATYRYPDAGDRVTAAFIHRHEPHPGYWERSEERAFARLRDRLAERLGPRVTVRAIDAGCGDGRLLGWLAGLAATITAADPDPDRLAAARHRGSQLPPGTATTFQVSGIAELTGGPYDLALCSHVVQHVPTSDVLPILRALHRVTAPAALLALACSRSPFGRGGFSVDRIERGELRSDRVGRAEFDHALAAGGSVATLPVRHFDPEELAAEAVRAGWHPVWDWTYHVLEDLGEIDAHVDRDELVNATPQLRRELGRDIVTLWQRDEAPAPG